MHSGDYRLFVDWYTLRELREELRTKTRTDHNKAKANKSVKHVEV